MPKFKVETTVQIRRVYEIEAASADEAEDLADTCGSECLVHEEDVSEEIDNVAEIKPKAE